MGARGSDRCTHPCQRPGSWDRFERSPPDIFSRIVTAMIQVDQKPSNLGRSGWEAILPTRQPQHALEQDVECDYLVVGAGFAGLSAARRLRQLDAKAGIVIVEADEVASGPAGRNSGFMIDLPHALASGSYAGDDSRDRCNINLNRAAIGFAEDNVRQYGFPSESFARSGKVNAAAGPIGPTVLSPSSTFVKNRFSSVGLMRQCGTMSITL